MTRAEQIYAETLNLLGSDLTDVPEIREVLDQEHAAADPAFARVLAKRHTMASLVVL